MQKKSTKHLFIVPLITFLVIAAGLVLIWARLNGAEERMLALRTQTTTEQVAFRLESFITARLHVIRQVAQQWQAGQINTPEQFRQMALSIEAEFSSLQAINWIDSEGVIQWLVPEEANLEAKGRALSAHAGLGEILRQAAASNQPRASAPLSLFQGGRGFGTYFPLVREGKLEGYINGVFRMRPVIRDCLQKGALGDFYLQVEDGTLLYSEGPPEVFTQSPQAQSHPVHVLDRTWTLTLVPTPAMVALYKTKADEVLLAVGLLLAAGFAAMLKSFMHRQEALRENEERLRLAVENMPAMVAAFDEDGEFIVWNRHCEQVTGYSSVEIVGNSSARELLQVRSTHGDNGAAPLFGLADASGQEWTLTSKDGSVRTISWSNAPGLQVPGWNTWGVGIDVTQRRKTEDALQLTQFALDHAAVATFWVREDASFFYVNEAACESLGYTQDELLRMGIFDIDPQFARSRWSKHWADLNQRGSSMVFESMHRRKDGATFPVEITASPLYYRGNAYQVAFAKDLTERKRAEEERLAMERGLLETQRLESLGLLAGGVAHDFNNLLTAVMGSASLARTAVPEDAPVSAHLGHIESAAQQAADLARQLLAYSGKGRFVVTTFDLRSAVHETDHLLRVSIPKHVTVDCELGDEPLYVKGDPGQIRQIVMNLVINAAEAIGSEEGTVKIRTRLVKLDRSAMASLGDGSLPESEYILLQVSDNGPGIDAATREHIFEPFFSTKATGRGLGLAAVMGIVRGHRGVLRLNSAPGQGTTFSVYLPVSKTAPELLPAEEGRGTDEPAGTGTVLVVDDEESVRTVAQIILEDSGYSVLTAPDGQEGVELFRAHADDVRLVLLDLTMPHMDGRQAMERIRQIRPNVRVLLSSGYDEQEASEELSSNRTTAFIQKPYRADQLLRKIGQMLAK